MTDTANSGYRHAVESPVLTLETADLTAARTACANVNDMVATAALYVVEESARQIQVAARNGTGQALIAARKRAALKVTSRLGLSREELDTAAILAGAWTEEELAGSDPGRVAEAVEETLCECCADEKNPDELRAAWSVMVLLEAMWPDVVLTTAAEPVREYATPW